MPACPSMPPPVPPARPTGTSAAAEIPRNGATSTFHAFAVMVVELLKVADPTSDWKQRLVRLLDASGPPIDERAMGFLPGWRQRRFWA